jgi:imidazolonepropionase-like amidohydrolase
VFVHNGQLVAVDFDDDSGDAGPARPLSDDPAMFVSASRAGDLLYLSGDGLRLRGTDGGVQTLGWPLSFRAPAAPPPLLIRGARVVPGDGSPALPPQDVLVREGRIASITPTGTLPPPHDAEVVEAGGRWLIPGLIEMHLHSWMDSALPALLYAGVTTARDLGAPIARVAGFRDAGEAGVLATPRLVFGSLQFTQPFDGYSGDSYSGPSDEAGFHRAAALMRALGATHVKFRPEGTHTRELARLAAIARREGWPVTGHYASLPLVAAGVSGKEHGGGMDHSDMVQLYASAGVWVVPTLAEGRQRLRVMDDPELIEGQLVTALVDPFLRYLIRADADTRRREEMERATESSRRAVARLHNGGVTVLAGTDAPGQPWAIHWELEELVSAGLSPLEALSAATGSAARALGAEEIGAIEVGRLADLVLLDADPMQDIRNTRRIWKVIQGGRVVDREGLLEWAIERQESRHQP